MPSGIIDRTLTDVRFEFGLIQKKFQQRYDLFFKTPKHQNFFCTFAVHKSNVNYFIMKLKIIVCSILAVCIVSCTMDDLFPTRNEKSYCENTDQLLPFAKALHSAMKDSPALRELIKKEALVRFNKEYEVLYQFIKEERVENGLSVRRLLLKYFENEAILASIEANHPALTIHIPILPEKSFSAEIWNTGVQVPAVAIYPIIHSLNTTVVARKGLYNNNSEVFEIDAARIPAFPVVVLKDNARVVVSRNASSRYASLNNKNSDYVFDFVDDYYDGSIPDSNPDLRSSSFFPAALIDQKVIDAYEMYKDTDGWQRNYIYYNITPSNPTGMLSNDFKESVIGFQFYKEHDPAIIINQLSNSNTAPHIPYPWTEGQINFKLTAEKWFHTNTNYPSLITAYFSAYPEALFEVSFRKNGNTFIPSVTGHKPLNLNIPLMTWDIEHYSEGMKISVWKLSPSATVTTINTTNTTSTITTQYYISDRHLGDGIVLFGDPVITGQTLIGNKTLYGLIDYNISYCFVNIIPVKQ